MVSIGCISACAGEAGDGVGFEVESLVVGPVLVVEPTQPRKLDLLFVVDNSSSMASIQGRLADSMHDFVSALDHPSMRRLDYRVAVVDTGVGQVACEGLAGTPGAFHVTSCLDRPADFVDARNQVSRFNTACASVCALPSAELATTPTRIAGEAVARPRPWIEGSRAQSNLASGIAAADALACLIPTGLRGCEFASPLEAMLQAIAGSFEVDSPAYGFIRDDASLQVVIVSDQADCSVNLHTPGVEGVFDASNQSFWPAGATEPGRGVCWRAGVQCEERGHGLDCEPDDFDIHRRPLPPGVETSVLWPLARYTEFLTALGDRKREHGAELVVSFIGGVDRDGRAPYYHRAGSAHSLEHGIEPGCSAQVDILDEIDPSTGAVLPGGSAEMTAVPPVRIAHVIETLRPNDGAELHMVSACEGHYATLLWPWIDPLSTKVTPLCYRACVRDFERRTAYIDAECELVVIDGQSRTTSRGRQYPPVPDT